MSKFLKSITSMFKVNSNRQKTLEQLETEMRVIEAQLKAIECFKSGEYQEAVDLFESYEEIPTADHQPYYNRGECYQWVDRHPSAIKDFSKYIDLHPSEWESYYLRAESYLEMEDFVSELGDLKRVRDIITKKRRRTEEEAAILGDLEYKIKKAGINAEYHQELFRIKGEFEQTLEDEHGSNPNYSRHDPRNNVPKRIYDSSTEKAIIKGLQYDKDRHFVMALEYYDYAAERKTSDSRVYSLRAYCLQVMEFYLDAIEDFEKALVMAPDDPNLHFGIGKLL